MPALDHAGIFVSDLDATAAFYATYLDATPGVPYDNPATGLRGLYLTFPDGGRLEVMERPDRRTPRDPQAMGWVHAAFRLDSREEVDGLVARMAADGHTVSDEPEEASDGTYEAVVLDPDGNEVELIA